MESKRLRKLLLSHLLELENLHNWWLSKNLFAPLWASFSYYGSPMIRKLPQEHNFHSSGSLNQYLEVDVFFNAACPAVQDGKKPLFT